MRGSSWRGAAWPVCLPRWARLRSTPFSPAWNARWRGCGRSRSGAGTGGPCAPGARGPALQYGDLHPQGGRGAGTDGEPRRGIVQAVGGRHPGLDADHGLAGGRVDHETAELVGGGDAQFTGRPGDVQRTARQCQHIVQCAIRSRGRAVAGHVVDAQAALLLQRQVEIRVPSRCRRQRHVARVDDAQSAAQHPRPDRYLLLQTPGERKGPARLRIALDGEHQAAGLLEIDRPGSLVDQAVRLDGRAGLDEAMIGQGSRLREEYGIARVNPGARRVHPVTEFRQTFRGIEQDGPRADLEGGDVSADGIDGGGCIVRGDARQGTRHGISPFTSVAGLLQRADRHVRWTWCYRRVIVPAHSQSIMAHGWGVRGGHAGPQPSCHTCATGDVERGAKRRACRGPWKPAVVPSTLAAVYWARTARLPDRRRRARDVRSGYPAQEGVVSDEAGGPG